MRLGPLHPGELVRQVPARTAADVARSREFIRAGFYAVVIAALGVGGSVGLHVALDDRAVSGTTIGYSGYDPTPIPRSLEIDDGVGHTLATFRATNVLTVYGKIVVEGKNGSKIVLDPDALDTGAISISTVITNARTP